MVVMTTTRSGITGSFSCAKAQTVSVRTAGDMPVTARRMVEGLGLRVEGLAGVFLMAGL
jgi:hypothetical protein